jgi:hypothetical protein
MRKLRKSEMRQRGRELRSLLNEWDPIGVSGLGDANDEYDCLLWPLMRMLEEDSSVEALAAYLTTELREHFGLDPSTRAAADFATRTKNWFESGWQGTHV